MKKDDRNAAAAIEVVEPSSVGKVGLAVHLAASAHLYERCLVFVIRGRGDKGCHVRVAFQIVTGELRVAILCKLASVHT
jgi:hypothetical protein